MNTRYFQADPRFSNWNEEDEQDIDVLMSSARRCFVGRTQKQRELIVSENPNDLANVFVSFASDYSGRIETELRVGILEKVVLELRHSVLEIASRLTISVPIVSLAPEPYSLKRTLFVVVQPEGNEFSATFFDANINASGDTQVEAIDNLKDILVSTYRRFSSLGEAKLGPGPRKQLAVLQDVLEPA